MSHEITIVSNTVAMPCSGDGCYCRRGLPVHPPVLAFFDPERGEYVTDDEEHHCTALWASGNFDHIGGQICGRPAAEFIGDSPVCAHHYRRTRQWIDSLLDEELTVAQKRMREISEENKRLDRERTEQLIELDKRRILAEEAARSEHSLVYYIRRESDGMIKIGTSRTLAARLATLKSSHGPLTLMAVHGGTHREEHAIHDRFDRLRSSRRTEWFRPWLPLLEHILKVRGRCEIPVMAGLPPVMDTLELEQIIRRKKRKSKRLESASPAA